MCQTPFLAHLNGTFEMLPFQMVYVLNVEKKNAYSKNNCVAQIVETNEPSHLIAQLMIIHAVILPLVYILESKVPILSQVKQNLVFQKTLKNSLSS